MSGYEWRPGQVRLDEPQPWRVRPRPPPKPPIKLPRPVCEAHRIEWPCARCLREERFDLGVLALFLFAAIASVVAFVVAALKG